MADVGEFDKMQASLNGFETVCIDEDNWHEGSNNLAMQNIAEFLKSIAS